MSPLGLVVRLLALSLKVLGSVPPGDMSFYKGISKRDEVEMMERR